VTRTAVTVWTIGHSTHPIDEFLALLRGHEIRVLADIRHYPTSRWPQFKQEALRESLSKAGIEYIHIAELGGYRKGGYPTFMKTEEFAHGIGRLVAVAGTRHTAIMCAEAVFFRCHRRYVADAITSRGGQVVHIFSDGRTRAHTLRTPIDDYA
jgi:uncharacterized protein (DUF488 family)